MKIWPVIELEFAVPPERTHWDLFINCVMTECQCLGIEEVGDGPFSAGEEFRRARLFFPASDAGPEETRFQMLSLRARIEADCMELLAEKPEELRLELLPDEDWGATWRKFFRRVRITSRIYCGPPWESSLPADSGDDAFIIVIEPGQAFGTGTHETTKLCLQIMENHVVPDSVVFDVGAGSGILSIASVKLGARHALAMEYDPVCLENFLLNLDHNGLKGRATFLESADPAEALKREEASKWGSPRLILCNMLSVRFMPLLPALRAVGSPLILSGFLLKEVPELEQELGRIGFQIMEKHELGDWGAFVCHPA